MGTSSGSAGGFRKASRPLRPLLLFFALAYAAMWTCFGVGGALVHQAAPAGTVLGAVAAALFLLGAVSPGIVALLITDRTEGRAATLSLLRRVAKWEVAGRWYLVALAFIPAVEILTALLHRAMTGAWPAFGQTPWYLMAAGVLVSTWVQAGEEIGWRGFALPRLAERGGLPMASLVLGVIWAAWHIPQFLVPTSETYGQSFPLYVLQVTALSVVMAWLYWRTGGSLLLVMIFHAAVNNVKDIVPSADPNATSTWGWSRSPVAWITLTLLWVVAGWCLVRMRNADPRDIGGSG